MSEMGSLTAGLLLLICSMGVAEAQQSGSDEAMLIGDWLPADTHQIDYLKLPLVPSEHLVISDVRDTGGVNQHNYLAVFDGRLFVMWSDGPGVEDRVGQRVRFAVSDDGLQWSKPEYITPEPPDSGPDSPHYGTRSDRGMRWISRGFWQREGELIALCALDEAAGFFGRSLELRGFRWTGREWEDAGVIAKNAINNFPPRRIPDGQWMMSRRKWNYRQTGVEFLVGGVRSLSDWVSSPVLGSNSRLSAEEPLFWGLPDGRLVALFRDNRGSKFLYRSVSADLGKTWTPPQRSNFPDATSKFLGLRLSDGRYVLISNSNPRARDPLTIAVSEDGLVFTRLAWLIGGRHVDYPHALEHEGSLLVAFAGGKQSVELLKIKLSALNQIRMPAVVEADSPLPPIRKNRRHGSVWIDLGNEDSELYVAVDLKVPGRGESAEFALATAVSEERVRIRVDERGEISAALVQSTVTGPQLAAGSLHTLLLKIVSHTNDPDQLFLQIEPRRGIPEQPKQWLLRNELGSSAADLSRAVIRGAGSSGTGFSAVRIADTYAALLQASVVPGGDVLCAEEVPEEQK